MIDLAMIESARKRIEGAAIRTPLVRLQVQDAPADIYLKLENQIGRASCRERV